MSDLICAFNEARFSYSHINDNGGIKQKRNQPGHPDPDNCGTMPHPLPVKKRRNQPGHPDPDAEVIALSPRTLLATNRYVCEICNKGFQRDQNLQLHKRGHNLPYKLKKQITSTQVIRKKVYVCPETSCVHHDPTRALGDLTGIKKHFFRKHGEKKWKCGKCSKKYAVQSDWKAHSKICGTKEYRCDCGAIFSRRDSFVTHREICDALSSRSTTKNNKIPPHIPSSSTQSHHIRNLQSQFNTNANSLHFPKIKKEQENLIPPAGLGPRPFDLKNPSSSSSSSIFQYFQQNQELSQNPNSSMGPTFLSHLHMPPPPHISATALLQKAAQMGSRFSPSLATAGFGLKYNFSSINDHGLGSYGSNKAATVTGGSTNAGDDMTMNYSGFDHGSALEEFGFGGILRNQRKESFHATLGGFSSGNEGGGGDNMTRDFLGFKEFASK